MERLEQEMEQERKKQRMLEIKLRNSERAREDAENRNRLLEKEMEDFFSTLGDLALGARTSDIWPGPAGLYFGVRCLTRARVLHRASGRSFIWKVKKKNKIGELDITCVHSGQTQTERWSWRMQISNWKWPSPSPRSTNWFWLSYACLKWTVKMRRRRSLMSPVFVLWRQCFNSAGACMYLTGGTLCTFSDILYTGEHWLLQPLLYKDTTRMDCLLKLQDPIETLMLISIFIWY